MSRKDISDLQVVQAYADVSRCHGHQADVVLMETTGECLKVCLSAMERAERRGYVDGGVTLSSGWLTDKGRALLETGDE